MKLLAAIAGGILFYLGCYMLAVRYGVLWLGAALVVLVALAGLLY